MGVDVVHHRLRIATGASVVWGNKDAPFGFRNQWLELGLFCLPESSPSAVFNVAGAYKQPARILIKCYLGRIVGRHPLNVNVMPGLYVHPTIINWIPWSGCLINLSRIGGI